MFWMPPFWFAPPSCYQTVPVASEPQIEAVERSSPQEPVRQVIHRNNEQNLTEKQQFWKFFKRLLKKKHMRPQKKAWNKTEDQILVKYREDGLQWQEIAEKLGIYNSINCERRFNRLEKLRIKWPPAIDLKIKDLVEIDKMKWIQIAKLLEFQLGNSMIYTGKMVRERYKNYLRPGIIRKQWTIQDDIRLMKMVLRNGTIWSKFTDRMEGRSELELKNRYHGILEPMRKKIYQYLSRQTKTEQPPRESEN